MSTHARRAHAVELLAPALVVVDSSRAAAPSLLPPAIDAALAGGSRSRCKAACTTPAVLTTAWNLINGMLGASFVSIPFSVNAAGPRLGFVTLVLAAAASAYSLHLLVRLAATKLTAMHIDQLPSPPLSRNLRSSFDRSSDDHDAALAQVEERVTRDLETLNYSSFLELVFGPIGFLVGSVLVLLFDFGAMCVFLVSLADTIPDLFGHWCAASGNSGLVCYFASRTPALLLGFAFMFALCLVREIRSLWISSFLSDMCALVLVIVFISAGPADFALSAPILSARNAATSAPPLVLASASMSSIPLLATSLPPSVAHRIATRTMLPRGLTVNPPVLDARSPRSTKSDAEGALSEGRSQAANRNKRTGHHPEHVAESEAAAGPRSTTNVVANSDSSAEHLEQSESATFETVTNPLPVTAAASRRLLVYIQTRHPPDGRHRNATQQSRLGAARATDDKRAHRHSTGRASKYAAAATSSASADLTWQDISALFVSWIDAASSLSYVFCCHDFVFLMFASVSVGSRAALRKSMASTPTTAPVSLSLSPPLSALSAPAPVHDSRAGTLQHHGSGTGLDASASTLSASSSLSPPRAPLASSCFSPSAAETSAGGSALIINPRAALLPPSFTALASALALWDACVLLSCSASAAVVGAFTLAALRAFGSSIQRNALHSLSLSVGTSTGSGTNLDARASLVSGAMIARLALAANMISIFPLALFVARDALLRLLDFVHARFRSPALPPPPSAVSHHPAQPAHRAAVIPPLFESASFATGSPVAFYATTVLLSFASLSIALSAADITAVVQFCGGLAGVPLFLVLPPLAALVLAYSAGPAHTSKLKQHLLHTSSDNTQGISSDSLQIPSIIDHDDAHCNARDDHNTGGSSHGHVNRQQSGYHYDWLWLRAPWRLALHSLLLAIGLLFAATNALHGVLQLL